MTFEATIAERGSEGVKPGLRMVHTEDLDEKGSSACLEHQPLSVSSVALAQEAKVPVSSIEHTVVNQRRQRGDQTEREAHPCWCQVRPWRYEDRRGGTRCPRIDLASSQAIRS